MNLLVLEEDHSSKRFKKDTEEIRFETKEIEIDLSKLDEETNQILKCEIYSFEG